VFPIPWYVVLLVSIPEAFLIILIGFALFNLKIDIRTALIISIFEAIAVYTVRLFPVIFGLHTLTGFLVMLILTNLLTKTSFRNTFMTILTGLVSMGAITALWTPAFLLFTSSNVQDLAQNPILNVICFIPIAFIGLVFYWLVKKYRLILFDLNR
jgi:hypothetical protein